MQCSATSLPEMGLLIVSSFSLVSRPTSHSTRQ